MLQNRLVILGITGSIAAVKSPELARELMRQGATVQPVMTSAAETFVSALSMHALTGKTVISSFSETRQGSVSPHIELSRRADAIVVAPATADFIARLARGRADDVLSAMVMAANVPLVIAPAMNRQMWENSATQTNVDILRGRGVTIVGPSSGDLADLSRGTGRMSEPLEIVEALAPLVPTAGELSGTRVVVTYGATRDYLDPVRFISSPSSGKMGLALARELRRRGARVDVVAANVCVEKPIACAYHAVDSFDDMARRLDALMPEADALCMCAAVNDFAFAASGEAKIKRSTNPLSVELTPTRDLVAEIAATYPTKTIVGFAAETSADMLPEAKRKLVAKGVDMVVVNRVGRPNLGFGADETELALVEAESATVPRVMSKGEAARLIVDKICRLLSPTS